MRVQRLKADDACGNVNESVRCRTYGGQVFSDGSIGFVFADWCSKEMRDKLSGSAFRDGVEQLLVNGVDVPVFNAAKTVADCFKYRNKIGIDVALEALRDGWARRIHLGRHLALRDH
jgi:hypothetical protein